LTRPLFKSRDKCSDNGITCVWNHMRMGRHRVDETHDIDTPITGELE